MFDAQETMPSSQESHCGGRYAVKSIKDLPIYQKLLALIVLSSGVSLLVAGIVIVAYDVITHTEQTLTDLRTQAEIIGASSAAALEFNDPGTARQYLSTLDVKQSIDAAAIFGPDGQLFAVYARQGAHVVLPKAEAEGSRIVDDTVVLFHTVKQGEKVIGTVYLLAQHLTAPIGWCATPASYCWCCLPDWPSAFWFPPSCKA
jgi:hypothetical protein